MKLKHIFATPKHSTLADAALLLFRVVAGLAFMHHGWSKIQDPFHWMDQFPGAPPAIFQGLAALAEFGGGIAWGLGLLTPLASFGLACTMAVAVRAHAFVLGDPFVASGPGQGSYEPAAIYLCLALYLMARGPGRFSLDKLFFGSR